MLSAIEELGPTLRRHAAEADRLARLPDAVVRALLGAGLFRLWIPRSCGGFELDLPETLRVYEAAARVDGSVGWAVMIGSGGGLFAAYLSSGAASELYSPRNALIAGSGAPSGNAERVEGGYRASGRWRYASGAHYATTFTANCVVTSEGQPVLDSNGAPLIRAMAFEPSQVKILETWDTTGMRGTGSHDFEVTDAFVPESHTFSVFTDAPREAGALYTLPFTVLTELPVAAVGLGIAHHALEAFAALAPRKKSARTDTALSDDSTVTAQYAESHARWRFARARVYELASEAWEVALSGRALNATELAEITSGCALCLSELRAAIAPLAAVSGMSSIQRGEDFARAWQDLQTLGAHVSVSPLHFASAGRALLSAEISSREQ